jgi:hypothetical protein
MGWIWERGQDSREKMNKIPHDEGNGVCLEILSCPMCGAE